MVKAAIGHTCERRGWGLYSVNVRTNHVHVVVAAACGPSRVLNGLKSNATRELREAGNWKRAHSPQADGGSKRYLWTEEQLVNACAYVQDDQGEPLD